MRSYRPLLLLCGLCAGTVHADPLKLKYPQGALHAYLLVKTEDGKVIATADESTVPVGRAWRSRLTMHFVDGSLDDETTTFVQQPVLRLLTDHHVQKGPSFPKPADVSIDMKAQTVTWLDVHDGKDEMKTDHMDLPPDLANGMVPLITQNVPKGMDELKIGYLAMTPKPRVVKLAIHEVGKTPFRIGGAPRSAMEYRLHIDLGGITGVIAPMIGKEPADLYVYVTADEAPTFVRLKGYLYLGGPTWNVELTSPAWAAQ